MNLNMYVYTYTELLLIIVSKIYYFNILGVLQYTELSIYANRKSRTPIKCA